MNIIVQELQNTKQRNMLIAFKDISSFKGFNVRWLQVKMYLTTIQRSVSSNQIQIDQS